MKTSLTHFKYFVMAMGLDLFVILFSFVTFYDYQKLSAQGFILIGGAWLFSNIISYSKSNRRYISYIHTYWEIILPFFYFVITYLSYLSIFYPNWSFSKSFVFFFGYLFFIILVGKAVFVFALRLYRSMGYGYSSYLLIGPEQVTNYMRGLFDNRLESGYRFKHAFEWNEINKAQQYIELLLKKNLLNEIYCYPSENNKDEINRLIGMVENTNINCYLIPFDSAKHINFYNFRRINGKSVDEILKGPLINWYNRWLKRLFDVLFSLAVIVFILSWLIPVLGIFIMLGSRGGIFFIQKRAGRNGRYFPCLKLRTMYKNDEADLSQAVVGDKRITKIGRLLRATSLDEIPQFFNVLLGQMSVLGPRPHIRSLNEKFSKQVPFYGDRFLVKPGISGLSQIHGYRGETPTTEVMQQRVDVDRLYIQNWTFLLDLRILFSTVKNSILIGRGGAY